MKSAVVSMTRQMRVAVVILLLSLSVLIPAQTATAGINGQQLKFICYHAQGPVIFKGKTSASGGSTVTLTVPNGPAPDYWNGFSYVTAGYYWKGEVEITYWWPVPSAGGQTIKTFRYVYVPQFQIGSDIYTYTC